MTHSIPCPACRTDLFTGTYWTDDEWDAFCSEVRTPICPRCIRVVIFGGSHARLPEPRELLAIHLADESIDVIQRELLRRLGRLAVHKIARRLARRGP